MDFISRPPKGNNIYAGVVEKRPAFFHNLFFLKSRKFTEIISTHILTVLTINVIFNLEQAKTKALIPLPVPCRHIGILQNG